MPGPRHFENNLKPVALDEDSLRRSLTLLQVAIDDGIAAIRGRHEQDKEGHEDTLYTGDSGSVLVWVFEIQWILTTLSSFCISRYCTHVPPPRRATR